MVTVGMYSRTCLESIVSIVLVVVYLVCWLVSNSMCRLCARLSLFIYVASISPGTEATLLYILDTHQFGNGKIISLGTQIKFCHSNFLFSFDGEACVWIYWHIYCIVDIVFVHKSVIIYRRYINIYIKVYGRERTLSMFFCVWRRENLSLTGARYSLYIKRC